MKVKLKKEGDVWIAGMYRGKGGISSLTIARHTKSFWKAISLFSIKNFIRHYKLIQHSKHYNS